MRTVFFLLFISANISVNSQTEIFDYVTPQTNIGPGKILDVLEVLESVKEKREQLANPYEVYRDFQDHSQDENLKTDIKVILKTFFSNGSVLSTEGFDKLQSIKENPEAIEESYQYMENEFEKFEEKYEDNEYLVQYKEDQQQAQEKLKDNEDYKNKCKSYEYPEIMTDSILAIKMKREEECKRVIENLLKN